MATAAAGRLRVRGVRGVRDWALFALAAMLPAIALAVLGLRALVNEEAAIEREAKLALVASADRLAASIRPELDAAARSLAVTDVDPARLTSVSPPFAEPVVLGPDRKLESRRREPPSAPASVDPGCAERLSQLGRTRDPGARATLRASLLTSCAEMRTAGERWLYPILITETFTPAEGPALADWVEAHASSLSSRERAAIREDTRELRFGESARVTRALSGGDEAPAALTMLLRESEASQALSRGPDETGAITWTAPSSLGSLRKLADGRLAGFVAHRASIDAALGSPWAALPREQRATVERPGVSRETTAIEGRHALTTELTIAVRLADPALLGRRTARSRTLLMTLASGATVAAFGVGALLFARMRAARRASELRTDFVAAVSHELRTPIASVRMLAELLEENRVEEEERGEVYAALAAESRRLGATVDRLLSFARMASGKRRLTRTWQNVAETVAESIDVFDARRGAEPTVMRDLDSTVEASIDPGEIRLAVDNLLANARKHAPGGGPYTTSVSRDGDEVVITVGDHGEGIAPRDQRRIFEAFERADDRLSRATDGTGIGLSLVRHVARAHGGDVHVDSTPGETRFTIRIPRGTP